jgi:hypothetical protein
MAPVVSEIVTALGWVGGALLLFGYAQTSRGRWAADGPAFQASAILGSVALALVAAAGGVWPSAALNVAWTAIGIAVLARRSRPRGRRLVAVVARRPDAERPRDRREQLAA